MRELRFRAWDGERGAMLDGAAIEDFTEEVDEISYTLDCPRYQTGLSYGKLFVAYTDKRGEFTECEVMQFTGLHDRHGKPIYEGDILRAPFLHEGEPCPHMGKVVYSAEYGSFATQNEAGITLFHHHCINTREVIGDIYTTPELLEATK